MPLSSFVKQLYIVIQRVSEMSVVTLNAIDKEGDSLFIIIDMCSSHYYPLREPIRCQLQILQIKILV